MLIITQKELVFHATGVLSPIKRINLYIVVKRVTMWLQN
jgi:hypothetical protein